MKKINKVSKRTTDNDTGRYRTLLNAIYFNSTHFNDNHHTGEIIPFNMDEWYNTILKRPISHYKETNRTTTTNRIKRAHTANKTLYTSTLHTSLVPHRTTIQENRHKKANEMRPFHFIDTPPRGQKKIIWRITTRPPDFFHDSNFLK